MSEEIVEDRLVGDEPNESEADIDLDEAAEELLDGDQPEDGQDEVEEDDSEEIEFNDQSFKLPKDIAEGVKSMRKDYTEKTMALSEQRKSFELSAKFHKENIGILAKEAAINDQLIQFNQVDWSGLIDSDPILAQKLMAQQKQLENQRSQLSQERARKEHEMNLHLQQELAKQIEASESVLKREIKEWSPEHESKLIDFAVNKIGLDESDVKESKVNPKVYKILHLAYIGSQLAKQAKTTQAKPVTQAKPATTLRTTGGKISRSPANMSQAEYAKWRKQGYA